MSKPVRPGAPAAERSATALETVRERVAAVRAECEELERRAWHYRDLWDNAPVMLGTFEASNGRIRECNERLAATLGYAPAELIGTTIFDLFAEEDKPAVFAHFKEFHIRGERRDVFLRIRHRDGRNMSIVVSVRGIRDDRGRLVEGRFVLRELSGVSEIERGLAQSERRYRTLAENISLVPWEADADSVAGAPKSTVADGERQECCAGDSDRGWSDRFALTWIGPQIETVLGYRAKRFCEPGFWRSIVHPDDRERVLHEYGRLTGSGDASQVEYRLIAADGRTVWLCDSVCAVREVDGRLGLIGVLADVTERRAALARQSALMRELDHRVKDALATVQAVADRTALTETTTSGFRVRFQRRIHTLARIHDALAVNDWKSLTVADLAHAVEGDVPDGRKRAIALDGPEVAIPAFATRALALALGDLAASVGIGAGASPTSARARLDWSVQAGEQAPHLRLLWRPTSAALDGPAPDRYLIERALAYELDARVELKLDEKHDHDGDGSRAVCTIEIPLSRAAEIRDTDSSG